MNDLYLERLKVGSGLRRALERGECKGCYQPEVLLESGEIVGMEALVRWEHPEQGLVSPAQFTPVAEETGLIVPIGQWVLKRVSRQAKEGHERYPSVPPLAMSVNLPGKQFQHSRIVTDVTEVL